MVVLLYFKAESIWKTTVCSYLKTKSFDIELSLNIDIDMANYLKLIKS